MKRRCVCGLVLLVGIAGAGEWRVTREIGGETDATAVAAVPLDAHVFENSLPELADLRVLDSAGREVPRVIQPEHDFIFESRLTPREAKIKNLEQLADGGLAVVCEIERTNAVSLTRVTVRTPLRNYEQTVTVCVPDGEGAWRPVKAAEPLFDYSRFADVKKESVDFPALTNRQFKLVIGQADDRVFSSYPSMTEETDGGKAVQRQFKRYSVERRPFRIDAVSFSDTERVAVAKEKREQVTVRDVSVSEDAEHKSTVLTIRAARRPAVGVVLNPEQQNFERAVTVESEASGGWAPVARGRVVRSRLPGVKPRDEREVAFNEVCADTLRVLIRNDDNPPLTFGAGGVALSRRVYRVAFIAEKGERYRLAYCNPLIKAAPVYEQGVTAYLNSGQQAKVWSLSPAPAGAVAYGADVRARQFLAKRGMLLLSVAVMLALGFLILRAVKHVEKTKADMRDE